MVKSIFRILALAILTLVIALAFNSIRFSSRQLQPTGKALDFPIDSGAIEHLQTAIQIQTVSFENPDSIKPEYFDTLHAFLQNAYPLAWQALHPRVINNHSLLFHWKGTSTGLKPVILYAHMDVVPPSSDSSDSWMHPPFEGRIADGKIWGRGTVDDKSAVIGILEAASRLLRNGFHPKRDVYFAFGHDEEISGLKGAKSIAEELEKQGVKAEWLLDEGGLVAVDMVPFVPHPVALVMTGEKGYMSVEVTARKEGGHSSMPARETAADLLAKALVRLNEHPFPVSITEPLEDFMNFSGPEMRFPFQTVFANRWLFQSVINVQYEKIPGANAMIRTTAAVTLINGGIKENVIPSTVSATINLRLLPGMTSHDALEYLKRTMNDKSLTFRVTGKIDEAPPVSSTGNEGFLTIMKSINSVFPDAIVSPSLSTGGTDSKHFIRVTGNIYRFLPVRMNQEMLDGMHGRNEHIGVHDFMETIAFYESLLKSI